jgi:superfamily II DNA or RNA helicase
MYALSRGIEPEDDLAEEAADFSAFESALQKLKPSPVSVEIKPTPEIRQWFGQIQNAVADEHATDPAAKQRVYYRLQLEPIGGAQVPTVAAITRNILKSGALGATHDINPSTIGSSSPPKHWTAYDARLLSDLERLCPKPTSYKPVYRLDGPYGESILRKMLASGRCVWGEACLLELGQPAPARFKWQIAPKTGIATPVFDVGRGRLVLGLATPWYIEHATGKCGPVETELPARLAAALLRTSPILPEFIGAVRAEFESLGLPESVLPQESRQIIIRAPQPVPTLSVDFESCVSKVPIWTPAAQVTAPVAFAKLSFEYEGIKAPADGEDLRVASGNDLLILRRNRVAERYAQEILLAAGWQTTAYCGWEIPKGRTNSLCIVPPDNTRLIDPIRVVSEFSTHAAPKLVEAGWKIEIDQNIRYVPESQVEWDISLDDESGVDWFEFRLGIRVEGEAFDLRSILAQVFKADTQSRLNAGGARHAKSDDVFIFGLNGRAIKLSRQRLQAIIKPLTEIFGGIAEWPDDLRLSKSRLPELATLEESTRAANVPWKTSAELQRLRKQFAEFSQLEPMPEPEGFNGTLRTYQREGLAWLQFLRENGFGGVLADDMGLGKTVQVLAHIQTEKVSGRMDRPCLIVAPTSTMPNWRREAERFAPHLRVVTLQGTDRAGRFGAVKSADIVLTTYPLLARDKASLLKSPYHLVVLDEAQNVKNPATAAAKAVRELSARHRLCLSGTPVENHLGELWSLFHFLMPGFLGSETEFSKGFRTPIEKSGNGEVRERLARRVRPFMLRRTKGQVVKELPAKTEIIECVEFGDPQRDLYESIRVVMDEKVRELLASQGFNKSRIQILDALLKLRQVCCDPRLVKLPSAKSVADSAKLERLMEMLRILVEDGRRVLLFSQFTSMLDLIEARLREAGITWVRISGDTVDRDTPVRRFQAGEVPLFLISLKAGGTGLNLTAADTVILYDPWWNPAVENQAIDRAHRIGQEKPVMVYKLVASGTIEEKMLEIQDRKADIARSILSDDADGIQALTAEDLRWVFAKA